MKSQVVKALELDIERMKVLRNQQESVMGRLRLVGISTVHPEALVKQLNERISMLQNKLDAMENEDQPQDTAGLAEMHPPCELLQAAIDSVKLCRWTQDFRRDEDLAKEFIRLMKSPDPADDTMEEFKRLYPVNEEEAFEGRSADIPPAPAAEPAEKPKLAAGDCVEYLVEEFVKDQKVGLRIYTRTVMGIECELSIRVKPQPGKITMSVDEILKPGLPDYRPRRNEPSE